MKPNMKTSAFLKTRLLLPVKVAAATKLALASLVAVASLAATAHAAAPGITGPSFTLTAQAAFINQPDGQSIYSWGYGCTTAPAASRFKPAMPNANCPTMQVPGPTLIVTEGQAVTITLTNNLPLPAGNTSILFPGFHVSAATNG